MKTKILRILKWFFGILLGLISVISLLLFIFEDKICNLVVAEVNKSLTVPLKIAEIDLVFWGSFPNLSVDLKKVTIQDALPSSTKKDVLLYSEQIRLKFNPIDLINKNYHIKAIEISPGTLNLKVDEQGNENYMIFKSNNEKSEEDFILKLQQINFKDFALNYNNYQTKQFISTILKSVRFSGDFNSKKFTMASEGNMVVQIARSGEVNLLSNKKVDFNIGIVFNQNNNTMLIPKALIKIAGLPFELDGDMNTKDWKFRIQSKNIFLTDLVNNFSLDEKKDLNKFKGEGEINFDLKISNSINSEEPMSIMCLFGINNGELTDPKKELKIKNIKLNGIYTNLGGASKENLEISDFYFQTPGGPFSGNLKITEFANPYYVGKAKGNINLAIANQIFRLPLIEKIRGSVNLNTKFEFQKNTLKDVIEFKKCNGNIQLNNVLLKLKNDQRTFEKVNGNLFLRDNTAGIEAGSVKIGGTDLKIDGLFSNIFSYFKSTGDLKADLNIESNYLNVEDIGTTSKQEKIIDGKVYTIPNDIAGTVRLSVGSLKYGKHYFNNLVGNMNIQSRRIHFPQLSFVNAEALISGALVIEEKIPEIFTLTAQVATQNLKFKPMFKEWDNFNQTVISDQNIFGRSEMNLYFHAPFDLRTGIVLKSINARLNLKIYDGHLKNVLGFKDITESLKTPSGKLVLGQKNIAILEKKLSDVSFKTLENTILIHDGIIEIPKMLISSSALDLEMGGTHTFENMIDYRFGFEFRDLLNKESKTEFGEIVDDGTGMKIFMRMHGNLDNPIIEWDKKSRKEQIQQNRLDAKNDAKSILKTEFGLFKNDTSVKIYVPQDVKQEELKIQFGPATKTEMKEEQKKNKKDSKIKKTLQNWKEQQKKEEEEEFKIGG